MLARRDTLRLGLPASPGLMVVLKEGEPPETRRADSGVRPGDLPVGLFHNRSRSYR